MNLQFGCDKDKNDISIVRVHRKHFTKYAIGLAN